jgi:hypothetical protein
MFKLPMFLSYDIYIYMTNNERSAIHCIHTQINEYKFSNITLSSKSSCFEGTSCLQTIKLVTMVYECRGRVVNTLASYLGGPGFKSRAGDRLF